MEEAARLFDAVKHRRGLADLACVRGLTLRKVGRYQEAEAVLREALAYYHDTSRPAWAARVQLYRARVLRDAGSPHHLITDALLDALRLAEDCRRPDLVRLIEDELRDFDEEAHWRHVFCRVRGHGLPEDTASLGDGDSEMATVLFVNLRLFIPFCEGLDPREVMQALNQMLADLTGVLDRYQANVTCYLGGGFMALVRDADHAGRAVRAALDMLRVVEAFNQPRAVLGLKQLPASIGVATGAVCLGNIGTYRKMDFTAVGPAVNLAAWLMREADPAAPCLSPETYALVRDRFVFRGDAPRRVELKGLGVRDVWDVVGVKEGATGSSA